MQKSKQGVREVVVVTLVKMVVSPPSHFNTLSLVSRYISCMRGVWLVFFFIIIMISRKFLFLLKNKDCG